ncbi:MAG: SDR family NAD(P)-dependent oxidoreductase [Anaerolineae bacterium]
MPDALIWGASGGIGQALVMHLKNEGWRVFAAARNERRVPAEADYTYTFDATKPETIQAAATLVAMETEGLQLVVYAAGGILADPLDKLAPEAWQAVMAANLDGAYLAARSSINLLGKDGHMMFVGAYVDKITLPRMGAYTTAKAGLEALVTILQKENRKLKMTLVRPPAVNTAFWNNVPFKMPENAMQPEAVARAMLDHYQSGSGNALNL